MTTLSATHSAIPTEKELRRLLLLRKPEDVATLLALLDNPPPDAPESVVSLMAQIAKGARSFSSHIKDSAEKACIGFMIMAGVSLLFFVIRGENVPLHLKIMVWAQPLGSIVGDLLTLPRRAKIGNHAALLLARVNDERAVKTLADLWMPHPISSKMLAFNNDVSRELTRLLVERGPKRFDRATEKALRGLLEKALPTGRFAKATSRLRPARDLTEADMDVLLAVVRHVSQPYARRDPHTAEPNADTATLQTVAALNTPGTNYNLLRDTTQVLLKQRGNEVP